MGRVMGRPVGGSPDLDRVTALARRTRPTEAELAQLADHLGAQLSKGAVSCRCAAMHRPCPSRLKLVQAWALAEMALSGGALDPIGVGDGKTLLDLLSAMVMPGTKTAVLLIPPTMKTQLLEFDWAFYEQHWKLPNLTSGRFRFPGRPYLHVVAYSELSSPDSTLLLEQINPDLIICDEVQALRNPNAARTKRFIRYMDAHPKVRLCCWSGTLTAKSLKDYAHLAKYALKERAPVPLAWNTTEEWAGAIDPVEAGNVTRSPAGRLAVFCGEGEDVSKGFGRRLRDSEGVVSSDSAGNCNASLVFRERKIEAPAEIRRLLANVRASWDRPDGEALVDAFAVFRCLDQLASGFYYRWRFPRKEKPEVIDRWKQARSEWHRELRKKIQKAEPHLDSPFLCAKAAIRFYDDYEGPLPVWAAETWPDWALTRETVQHETETVWVDDFLVKDAIAWGREKPGIIWYEPAALGARLAEESGFPFYGPGEDAVRGLLAEKGDRTVIASIRSHHKERNLQFAFNRNLVCNPPGGGDLWEQLVGRTHRPGQPADEVTFDVYRHTPEFVADLDRALMLAQHIENHQGNRQKLLTATFGW